MTSLMDLPEELFILIIRHLDIKSIYNLYSTCRNMKTKIINNGVLRICNLSLNTLSTSKSLKLDMIKDIASQLHELNMCAVQDLRKTLLLPAIKRMKCLKKLDVSYTKITILDLLDLYKKCPTIKSISINFDNTEIATLPDKTLQRFQEMFANFTNVHFVTIELLSPLPLKILSKSSLNTLTYTVCDWAHNCYWQEERLKVPFNNFYLHMLNVTNDHITWQRFEAVLPALILDNTEYVVLEYINASCTLWCTPRFVQFFSEHFNITPSMILERDKLIKGNIVMFMWNKETTKFDESFYVILKRKIKEIFTCNIKISNKIPMAAAADIKNYDWISLNLSEPILSRSTRTEMRHTLKKRRIVAANYLLAYDNLFSEHKHINLLMSFSLTCVIHLPNSNNFLKKITYLHLSGTLSRYDHDFFSTLFKCCDNLLTLHIETSLSPCSSAIVRSITLSKSLKNLRLIDRKVNFKALFSSFSKCKQLENICIDDVSIDVNDLADPTALYENCTNLYNLYIYAYIKHCIEKNIYTKINSLIRRNPMHHVNFRVFNKLIEYQTSSEYHNVYDPYLGIFGRKVLKLE